jgi:hypothetical protein
MNAESEQVRSFVEDLEAMVGGSAGKAHSGKPVGEKAAGNKKSKFTAPEPNGHQLHRGNGQDRDNLNKPEKRPEQMIPFEEGELTDF